MYVICDLAMHIIIAKSNNYDVRDYNLDARIPTMYYQSQPESYQNIQNYLPESYLPYNSNTTNTTKKTGIVVPVIFSFFFSFSMYVQLNILNCSVFVFLFDLFRQRARYLDRTSKQQPVQHLLHHQHQQH